MTMQRRFLFLQGPHGPFFHRLGRMLRQAGAQVWRVGFNQGDAAFWHHRASYIPFKGTLENWPETAANLLEKHDITDIVLYGDTRPIHAQAIEIAREKGIEIHVFEEGYLRPYWVTYERGGANGHSKLMNTPVTEMTKVLSNVERDHPPAPARWGDMRQHMFYGALYHWFVMFQNQFYRNFKPHRRLSVGQEFLLYLRRLTLMPFTSAERALATRRVTHGGFPYHLCLLQLEHDASFQKHSPFSEMSEFLEVVIEGFAKGAPGHHHLVLKAHPLEDGRAPIRKTIKTLAQKHGVSDRVHYVRGGKLARLLNDTRSAITVNSTAAQQALWRGLPVKAFGDAIYAKPEFVSDQPLPEFFSAPKRPNHDAYRDFRTYLLETSQVAGGFYSAKGRHQLLRQIVDLMLSDVDPYEALHCGRAEPRHNLRLVT